MSAVIYCAFLRVAPAHNSSPHCARSSMTQPTLPQCQPKCHCIVRVEGITGGKKQEFSGSGDTPRLHRRGKTLYFMNINVYQVDISSRSLDVTSVEKVGSSYHQYHATYAILDQEHPLHKHHHLDSYLCLLDNRSMSDKHGMDARDTCCKTSSPEEISVI
ncbi:hypothetical protein JTE90_014644 [Oedothorax gibbosus]|uniref:Uncharacterized protein n=1 Tax=Oedothorax gibbosus TaxID=931172 RepID=A0AAV6VAH9_9ARAC|nr:hypothetical protein JTE90_014644 [Oedothorax gibbosus]